MMSILGLGGRLVAAMAGLAGGGLTTPAASSFVLSLISAASGFGPGTVLSVASGVVPLATAALVSGLATGATATAGLAGGNAGDPWRHAKEIKVPATKSVEASAPHLVLRFQNSAAIITGAMAAKPENAKRIAISKMPCLDLR